MKCYYCSKQAIHIKTYMDDVDGITYPFEHCEDHQDIDDMTQEAVDLWASQTTFEQTLSPISPSHLSPLYGLPMPFYVE